MSLKLRKYGPIANDATPTFDLQWPQTLLFCAIVLTAHVSRHE